MFRVSDPEKELEKSIFGYLSNNGYEYIEPSAMKASFDKNYAIDKKRLFSFIENTQPEVFDKLNLSTESGKKSFLYSLDKNIREKGIISVLKKGVKINLSRVILFYHSIDEKNPEIKIKFEQNIFSVTNQLAYSKENGKLELDLCIFINGLPVITIELKSRSSSTGWTYLDAEKQYKNDRSNTDTLFSFKRCIAHFAIDENYATFTTKIDGKDTFFMPFNKGCNNGAGNPIINGYTTKYIWEEILEKHNLTSLIKDFCYITKNEKNKEKLIFPRYHQWRVVNKLIKDVGKNGVGNKYLIQHSAGSGKSNSITWLSYKLVEAKKDGKAIYDSIIVVTDRKNLDAQITNNINKFMDVKSIVGRAKHSKELKKFLEDGKKIIITTVQKFPYIIESIGDNLLNKKFAVIIDEAHSSQSGKSASSLNMTISGKYAINFDDEIENILIKYMDSKIMPENASYFAFTATPKAKTIEMFGKVFDLYSMKQAIEEGFILDVLKNYIPFENYFHIYNKTQENPNILVSKTMRKLKKYVESQKMTLETKSEEMVNHFIQNTSKKINGKAKAILVTDTIKKAVDYYYIISRLLEENKTGYKAIVAFSGEIDYNGDKLTEARINGFPEKATPNKFKEDEYKILIVADKYQTGYDEPLLHTMYIDKKLIDVKAVQTLSRLNRSFNNKIDTCILDFYNNAENIKKAFQDYYIETELMTETDPEILYNLLEKLDSKYVYYKSEVNELVEIILKNENRENMEKILNTITKRYDELEEENRIEFKSAMKAFIRTRDFLSNILPSLNVELTKKSIFFENLIYRLKDPKEDKFSLNIIENITLDSYRLLKKEEIDIILEIENGKLKSKGAAARGKVEEKIDKLDNVVDMFNKVFDSIKWKDKEKAKEQVYKISINLSENEILKNVIFSNDKDNIEIEYKNVFDKEISSSLKNRDELGIELLKNKKLKESLFDYMLMKVKENYRSLNI